MTSREPPPDRPGDHEPEEVAWSFDDLDALWWDDVWPFRDDTAVEARARSSRSPAGAPAVELDHVPPPVPAILSARCAAARASAEAPWWARRFVWVSAVVAAAVVVAGLLLLGRGHGHDNEAQLLRSPTYSSPVALQPGTAYVRSRVLRSGDLMVTHWIRTRTAVDSLRVGAPLTPGLTPDSVRVTDVRLAAGGTGFPTPASLNLDAGTQTLFFPASRTVYLRYRLSGTVQHTGPGRRALARLTSLDVVPGRDSVMTTQVVTGAEVLAMACTSGPPAAMPRSLPAPCGSGGGSVWRVRLSAGQPTRVMAQVTLP